MTISMKSQNMKKKQPLSSNVTQPNSSKTHKSKEICRGDCKPIKEYKVECFMSNDGKISAANVPQLRYCCSSISTNVFRPDSRSSTRSRQHLDILHPDPRSSARGHRIEKPQPSPGNVLPLTNEPPCGQVPIHVEERLRSEHPLHNNGNDASLGQNGTETNTNTTNTLTGTQCATTILFICFLVVVMNYF